MFPIPPTPLCILFGFNSIECSGDGVRSRSTNALQLASPPPPLPSNEFAGERLLRSGLSNEFIGDGNGERPRLLLLAGSKRLSPRPKVPNDIGLNEFFLCGEIDCRIPLGGEMDRCCILLLAAGGGG